MVPGLQIETRGLNWFRRTQAYVSCLQPEQPEESYMSTAATYLGDAEHWKSSGANCTSYGASLMDFLTEFWKTWNEQWGATTATILALAALLKSAGKEIHQIWSAVWHWKGWTIVSRSYRKVITLYRATQLARRVMRRKLEMEYVRIPIRMYDNCLRDNPRSPTLGQLKEVSPAKPTWLNDYYVATALESLSKEGSVVKATCYSMSFWPPDPESYFFRIVSAGTICA